MKQYKLTGKWLVVGSITLVLAILGAGGYYTQHKSNENGSPNVVQAVQIKSDVVNKPIVIKQNDASVAIGEEEIAVYNKMHKMINTKIVAEDGKIWGETKITTENCDGLITEIKKSGYPDKATLLQFLECWKDNNYSSGVDEHNYLWKGLNGTLGKAKSLR